MGLFWCFATLIILGEIQACFKVLASLKYFCEDAPQYHVIATGSILGVAVNREGYTYPVGKVDEGEEASFLKINSGNL